ncbi:hypothetical protein ACHAXA_004179 [Cyclostephanos tholiformis]|uniref:Uncharacterized protein n=1 Tax=Cyclostephanos tholiformis TaxID=382380 RepID=A0ABD3RS87_9STRA
MSSSGRPPPVALAIVLVLVLVGVAVVSHSTPRRHADDDYDYDRDMTRRRRHRDLLYSGGDPLYWDNIEQYANLQSSRDIDPTIEARARDRSFLADSDYDNADGGRGGRGGGRCGRAFLFLPDFFASHGHGSQIQLYIMAGVVSTYLDRAMIVIDPPLGMDIMSNPGGSQFGCPVDAFHKKRRPWDGGGQDGATRRPSPSLLPSLDDLREDFPMGLSRLIHHPSWLSRGCGVPCVGEYTYVDWRGMAQSNRPDDDLTEIECANPDGTITNVVVVGGSNLRQYYRAHAAAMAHDRQSANAYRWAINLGGTPIEANRFANIVDERKVWDYVLGLMNRAGMLKFQPWIARDVERLLGVFDLPRGEYTAIHVRRGDKLAYEARGEVEMFWRSRGHTDVDNLPTDYVPFQHYLAQWDGPETCPTDDDGRPLIVRHNVYVATDDPVVVRSEIAALPNRVGPNSVLWNDCHELTFYFNPTDVDAYHLNGNGEGGFSDESREDNCFDRYHRNIVSIADMFLLCRARTFIGEYNSNWGRVIRTMRVRMNPILALPDGDGGVDGDVASTRNGLTYTLDTRVAWGSNRERTPGS